MRSEAAGRPVQESPFGPSPEGQHFEGTSQAVGTVLEEVGMEAKQVHSAIRKGVRVWLMRNGKDITAFALSDGCLNFMEENDKVLIVRFHHKGRAIGDIPRVRFQVVKVTSVSRWSYSKARRKGHNPKF